MRGYSHSEYKELKRLLYIREEGICYLCGKLISEEQYESSNIDHIIPKRMGGSSHSDNLSSSHQECNNRKGDNPPPPGPHRDRSEQLILKRNGSIPWELRVNRRGEIVRDAKGNPIGREDHACA